MNRRKILLIIFLIMELFFTGLAIGFCPSFCGDIKRGEGYLFSFAHITDTHLPESEAITAETIGWLANHINVSFVIHTGDIVNNPYVRSSWEDAYTLMHTLDGNGWAVLAGNHDVVRRNLDFTEYARYFGNDSLNHYYIVGNRVLFVLLSWSSMDGSILQDQLVWMDNVLESHKDLLAVVCIHPHLFGLVIPFNFMGVPNYEEVLTHLGNHDNVVLVLCGHVHYNWVRVYSDKGRSFWVISTEATYIRGYVRLFDFYNDRVEVYSYSPWTNQTYMGPLDRFTIKYNVSTCDTDGDFWPDDWDFMPTHILVPNLLLVSIVLNLIIAFFIVRKKV